MTVSQGTWSRALRLLFVSSAWGFVLWMLSHFGARLLPLELARRLSLQTYLTIVQILSTGFGLLLMLLLVPGPAEALGLEKPRAVVIAGIVLVTPAIFVIASYVAIVVSLPLLLEELRAGGAAAAQRNTGEFGAQLTHAPALLTLFWGALVSPICEELLFRGALWSAFRELIGAFSEPRETASAEAWLRVGPIERTKSWLLSGGISTLLATLVFGALHADMTGGLGRVRFVSALGLGLACGLARQHARSLAASIALHLVFNVFSIATARHWLQTETFPMRLGVPTLASLIAGLGIVLFGLLLVLRQHWKSAQI